MQSITGQRLRVLTWHVHGSYLYYLSQADHDFFLPVKPGWPHPYGGRGASFDFGANVHEIDADAVADEEFDCVLFQSAGNYLADQHEILSPKQRRLPRLFLEHDPPRQQPTDTRHVVEDPEVTVVHVTNFNRLMWDNGEVSATVIEHGVLVDEDVLYQGEIPRGLVAINDLGRRGRRLGLDVFEELRARVPLDLIGMNTESIGGLGEVPPKGFAAFAARYRFFFNPIRYTSLGLSVCEAMTIGMPVVGLATTEMPSVVENGVNGYLSNDLDDLESFMRHLIERPDEARRLGENARRTARERFGIERFVADWDRLLQSTVSRHREAGLTGVAG